jgi:uracil-DNA glycosylase family protein
MNGGAGLWAPEFVAEASTPNAPAAEVETTWTAEPFVPRSSSLPALADAAQRCKGCPLYADATQAVFGEGSTSAPIVLVGEQPGDQEDKQGHPFVGPAGRVLWKCIEEAGIDRDAVFATNAVKHFKHEQRGKRRLHKKPATAEVEACHPWIDAELRAVACRVVVALGATAARSLFGRPMPIAASRGETLRLGDRPAIVTYHPSAVLRADEAAAELRAAIVADLRRARELASARA